MEEEEGIYGEEPRPGRKQPYHVIFLCLLASFLLGVGQFISEDPFDLIETAPAEDGGRFRDMVGVGCFLGFVVTIVAILVEQSRWSRNQED